MIKMKKILIIGLLFISIIGCNRNEIDPKYPDCELNGSPNETIDCRKVDLEMFLRSIENNASLELRKIDLDILDM